MMFTQSADPRFGLLTTRLLLFTAIGMALLFEYFGWGERSADPVSVLAGGQFTSQTGPAMGYPLQAGVVLGSLLWLLGWWVPVSCWLTVFSLLGFLALRQEGTYDVCHVDHWLWPLVFIQAVWTTWERPGRSLEPGRGAAIGGPSGRYPQWVLVLSVLVIAWFHTLSGIGKWQAAGWQWADGVSLQLWLVACGNPSSPLVDVLVGDVGVALFVQRAILVIELLACLAIFNPWLRRLVGVALLVYYAFFLHCFVDWMGLAAQISWGTATAPVATGLAFPVLTYLFQAFLVLWFFLLPDRFVERWESSE